MSVYFQRVANEVLRASEEMVIRMEDGISDMLKLGELSQRTATAQTSSDQPEDDFEIEEEFRTSPLQGMTEGVLKDIMNNQAKPETMMEQLDAFRCAITWSEPFIVGLLAFHVVVFSLCLAVSRPNVGLPARISLMGFIAVLVRSAETLNQIAGRNWAEFATQNYFDRQGVFFAVMISGPLLFDCLVMLMLFVREASQLLITVKTNELKRKKKAASKVAKGDTKKKQ